MRFADWEVRLGEYLAANQKKPFRYGVHDCCKFSAEAVKAICGIDPMGRVKGYLGAKEARAIQREAGGLVKAVESAMQECGFSEILPMQARRGDVVMSNKSFGVVGCDGWNCAFVKLRGYTYLPLSSCSRAWRVE